MTPVSNQNVLQTPETGLLAPLQRLDCRLQQTIEVAQLFQGTAFQSYLVGSIKPAQQPAEVVVAESSLYKLAKTFGLSPFDIGVVVMAIAPELDRRYERLYASLQTSSQGSQEGRAWRKPRIDLALNLLGGGEAEQQVQQSRFAPQAPLARLLQPIDHAPKSLRQQTLQLNPLVSRYLLGQRSLSPQLSSYCQISWPQPSAANLMAANLMKETETLAADVSAPLLQVNLAQLIQSAGQSSGQNGVQSELKSFEAVQQVLLQGQLWNAVLYVESAAGLAGYRPNVIHPGLIQKLSSQLATYPGISVFTDPQPLPDAPDQMSLGQAAAYNIEKFRLRLMRSLPEFG
jgi:hypothetical protein